MRFVHSKCFFITFLYFVSFGWLTLFVLLRFFGQILLFYCIAHSPNPRLRETLPGGWERWVRVMLGFLEDCAVHSPAVAQDLELLRSLWPEN